MKPAVAVEIDPAVLIEPAEEIELFSFYTAGSISTASSISKGGFRGGGARGHLFLNCLK